MIHIDPTHDCVWKLVAMQALAERDEVRGQLAQLQRHVFGSKSERMPSVERELKMRTESSGAREGGTRPFDAGAARAKRRARAQAKRALTTVTVPLQVPAERRACTRCGRRDLKPLGRGRKTVIYEYVPAHLERRVHVQEVLACPCGGCIVMADPPTRPVAKSIYGPRLMAQVITAKCADSNPLYRMEKQLGRLGMPVSRSTLADMFHGAAEVLAPLSERLLNKIAQGDIVLADETPLKTQRIKHKSYVWTFISGNMIGYRFSPDRSGQTPAQVLGSSTGVLLVDAYTAYNEVCTPEGRRRAGCMAHVRRKFFDALPSAPEARQALDMILNLYKVERDALKRGISRTDEHLQLRQALSRPVLSSLQTWLNAQKPAHPPKGPMGRAIRYALNNWDALSMFLTDARIPLDNNASERALRVVALGRKNFMFVGHAQAGRNLAGLYSLVATCEANGVNPTAYIADVLMRVLDTPRSKLDALLPTHWRPPEAPPAAAAA